MKLEKFLMYKKSNKTSVTLVNNTAKTVDLTVPSNERWIPRHGYIKNFDDVTRTCRVQIYNDDDVRIGFLLYDTAIVAAGYQIFPNKAQSSSRELDDQLELIMLPGWYIRFQWDAGGASTGGTGNIYMYVLAVRV